MRNFNLLVFIATFTSTICTMNQNEPFIILGDMFLCKQYLCASMEQYLVFKPDSNIPNGIPVSNKGNICLISKKDISAHQKNDIYPLYIGDEGKVCLNIKNTVYHLLIDKNQEIVKLGLNTKIGLTLSYSENVIYFSNDNNEQIGSYLDLIRDDSDISKLTIVTVEPNARFSDLDPECIWHDSVHIFPFSSQGGQQRFEALIFTRWFSLIEDLNHLARINHEGEEEFIRLTPQRIFVPTLFKNEASMAEFHPSLGLAFIKEGNYIHKFSAISGAWAYYHSYIAVKTRDQLVKFGDKLHYNTKSIKSGSIMPIGNQLWLQLVFTSNDHYIYNNNVLFKAISSKDKATKFFRDIEGDWHAVQYDSKLYYL